MSADDKVSVSVSKKWIYMTIGMSGSYVAGMFTEQQLSILKKVIGAFVGQEIE